MNFADALRKDLISCSGTFLGFEVLFLIRIGFFIGKFENECCLDVFEFSLFRCLAYLVSLKFEIGCFGVFENAMFKSL